MKRKLISLSLILLILPASGCHQTKKEEAQSHMSYKEFNTEEESGMDAEEEEMNRVIALEHEKAWEEARQLRASITDTDFLQTKRPMSDDAIGPYNYHTGFIEDRAYNRTVYILALERAQNHLSVIDERLVLNLHSGEEIHIAEDLFTFIVDLIEEWNGWVKEGRFKIIQTEEGYYDIAPAGKNSD